MKTTLSFTSWTLIICFFWEFCSSAPSSFSIFSFMLIPIFLEASVNLLFLSEPLSSTTCLASSLRPSSWGLPSKPCSYLGRFERLRDISGSVESRLSWLPGLGETDEPQDFSRSANEGSPSVNPLKISNLFYANPTIGIILPLSSFFLGFISNPILSYLPCVNYQITIRIYCSLYIP